MCTVSAQTHESAYGEVIEFPLQNKYDNSFLVSSGHRGTTTLAAWSGHRREILLGNFDSSFSSIKYQKKHTPTEFDNLYTADFNNDKKPDFLLVKKQDKSIAVILNITPDSLKVRNTVKLSIEPEHVLICDYNNDKRLDVLVYARKTPGILPLVGNGKGGFSIGKIIVQDNAIGAIDYAQVNNDNLLDLVVWDWVKNELHVFYGVGRGRFIDQSVFPVAGEVSELITTSIVRRHSLDIILKMTQPSELQIWEGNDYGDFQVKNHIPFEGNVTDFGITDINNDGLNDIIASLYPASLQVVFNNDIDAFTDRIEYACGNDPQRIIVPYRYAWDMQNCIVFDKDGEQFIMYKNVMRSGVMTDTAQLATGVSPAEIISNDFNRDGIPDIALVNSKSKSLSLYFGQKSKIPFGPYSYLFFNEPNHLAFHSSTDTSLHLLITFSQSNQISYFSLDAANSSVSNAFIGSVGDAQVLEASMNYHNQAKFVTMNTTVSEGNRLSFYEQIGPITFIERTFHLLPPNSLLGASVSDLNNDRLSDIVYIYRTGDVSTVELGIAFGDSSYSMKLRLVSKEFNFPKITYAFIWLVDFDKDAIPDLLMQVGPPVDYLLVARGKGDGLFYNPQKIASDLAVEERSDVQIVDVDGDKIADIVVCLQNLKKVIWFRNQGECKFENGRTLITEPGLRHYVVTDIDADGTNDLAMTLEKKGVLKIVNGKQLPIRIRTSMR